MVTLGFFVYQSAFEPKSGPHNTLVWRKKPSSFWTKKCVMRIWMGMELSVWVVGGCTRKSGPAKLVVFWEVAVNICMACCVKESVKRFPFAYSKSPSLSHRSTRVSTKSGRGIGLANGVSLMMAPIVNKMSDFGQGKCKYYINWKIVKYNIKCKIAEKFLLIK